MANVIFGEYNPAGRLTHTFYDTAYVESVEMRDMNVRPNAATGFPGRTHRFYEGQPLWAFGEGLSYTSFEYRWADAIVTAASGGAIQLQLTKNPKSVEDCALVLQINVRNTGARSGDHSVLWYLAPPGAGTQGRPIKSLVDFDRITDLQPAAEELVEICIKQSDVSLADDNGDFQVIAGEWTLIVGSLRLGLTVTIP